MLSTRAFFERSSHTLTYVVWDQNTRDAIIIDPVLNYDPALSTISKDSIDEIRSFLEEEGLAVHYILETHVHADHLSGAQILKAYYPDSRIAIGAKITDVQERFRGILGLPHSFPVDGRQFDQLLDDGMSLSAGSILVNIIFTPGHTPACCSFHISDMVFTGDAMFMPDFGTGRCDFPGGSATQLFHSVTHKLFQLPEATKVYVGHDYMPGGRPLKYQTTIGEEKSANIHLNAQTAEDDFVRFRTTRDQQLGAPRLMLPSLIVNMTGGHLPEPEESGRRYLKLPLYGT